MVELVVIRPSGYSLGALGKSQRSTGDNAAEYCCPEGIVEDQSPRYQAIARKDVHRLKEQRHEHACSDRPRDGETHPVDVPEPSPVIHEPYDSGKGCPGNPADNAESRGESESL